MANRSRIAITKGPLQIVYGYDGPATGQAAPIANFLDALANAGGLNPQPGYFFQVFHDNLQYEERVEEAPPPDEQHNELVQQIDPTGEGTVINLGFVTGLTASQMMDAMGHGHWPIPQEHVERIRRGQCPQDGEQLMRSAIPATTMRMCLRPVEVFVWYHLLAAGDPYQAHAIAVLNAEGALDTLRHMGAHCDPPFNHLAKRKWNEAKLAMSEKAQQLLAKALEEWGAWLELEDEQALAIDEPTLAALEAAHTWCDQEDKSTEFMLAYMQDMANCDLDTVLAYLQTKAV